MKILSRVIVIVGLLTLVAGGVMLAKNAIDINQLHAVAISMRSSGFPNPLNEVMLTAGLSAVGGLLTGLGLTMPRARRGEDRVPPTTAPRPGTARPNPPAAPQGPTTV